MGKFYDLKAVKDNVDIWIAFGMGRSFSFISINRICTEVTFPPCLSCFQWLRHNGKGKKSAWQALELCHEAVTPSLEFLSTHPFQQLEADSTHFRNLERMTVIMYDKSSPLASNNETRMDLFCKHNRAIEKLPPTQVIKSKEGNYRIH